MRFKRTGEIEYDLTKTKKKAFAVALKKKIRLFTIFPNSISVFQTFSRFGKLLGKFQDFFKNSRLCANPGSKNGYYFCVILRSNTSRNSNTSKAYREKGKVKTFRTLSAVSATLKTSDVSLNLRFSVGTKPSRKMLIPVKTKIHRCSKSSIKFSSYEKAICQLIENE